VTKLRLPPFFSIFMASLLAFPPHLALARSCSQTLELTAREREELIYEQLLDGLLEYSDGGWEVVKKLDDRVSNLGAFNRMRFRSLLKDWPRARLGHTEDQFIYAFARLALQHKHPLAHWPGLLKESNEALLQNEWMERQILLHGFNSIAKGLFEDLDFSDRLFARMDRFYMNKMKGWSVFSVARAKDLSLTPQELKELVLHGLDSPRIDSKKIRSLQQRTDLFNSLKPIYNFLGFFAMGLFLAFIDERMNEFEKAQHQKQQQADEAVTKKFQDQTSDLDRRLDEMLKEAIEIRRREEELARKKAP